MKKIKSKKVLVVGGVVLITAAAAFFVAKKIRNKNLDKKAADQPTMSGSSKKSTGKDAGTSSAGSGFAGSANQTVSFPLNVGSEGTNVSLLQKYLNKLYAAGLTVDGVYGSKTQAAVKKYLGLDAVDAATFVSLYQKYNNK